MKNYKNFLFIIILFCANFYVQNIFAFNYKYQNKIYEVSDNTKNKIDRFVKTLNGDKKLINLINSLDKIKYSTLSTNNQKTFNYLYYKLEENLINQYSLSLLKNKDEFITKLASNTSKYLEVNDDYEFVINGNSYLLNVNAFYILQKTNLINGYLQIQNLKNEIFFKKGDKFFISKGGYFIDKNITIEQLKNRVLLFSTNKDDVLFDIKGNNYNAYLLFKYDYFVISDKGLFLSKYKNIEDLSNTILLFNNKKYYLIINPLTKIIFNKNILNEINNKDNFLNYVGKDLYFYKENDFDNIFTQIKNKSIDLTYNYKEKDDKIFEIYSWIIKNIKYDSLSSDFIESKITEQYYLSKVDNYVFTGIGAFKNKNTVCDGFTKLFLYMLYFAGIEDVKIEMGNINIGNNKNINHVWIKIGNYYYDPTWDINNQNQFKWYKLNQEEFYENRINYL